MDENIEDNGIYQLSKNKDLEFRHGRMDQNM